MCDRLIKYRLFAQILARLLPTDPIIAQKKGYFISSWVQGFKGLTITNIISAMVVNKKLRKMPTWKDISEFEKSRFKEEKTTC